MMARAKMIERMVSDKRRMNLQQRLAAQAAEEPRPARVAPTRRRAISEVIKNIEGRIRNRTFKIKKLIAQPKNIEVKKNGQVVQKMTV